jgi:hypothetical protein
MNPTWFAHYAQGYFERHLRPLASRAGLRFLQVGAFTGDASLWLLDNILTGPGSVLVDVDTWQGSDEPEHEAFDWRDVERTYDLRTRPYRVSERLIKIVATSDDFFAGAPFRQFDFAYIDGAHTADQVARDGANAFARLAPGGLLAFDDYQWKSGKGTAHDPGPGIDTFLAGTPDAHILEGLADDGGLQLWVRRAS